MDQKIKKSKIQCGLASNAIIGGIEQLVNWINVKAEKKKRT